jgi:DNA-binding NarL/FixJ family response regulator
MISVLVVDDHRHVRENLRNALRLEGGIRVIGQAGDGLEAIVKTKKLRPNVILMDVKMPKIDGIEAARQIKAEYPETQIIIFSLYTQTSLVSKAMEMGVSRYLAKDQPIEEIARAIREVWDGRDF